MICILNITFMRYKVLFNFDKILIRTIPHLKKTHLNAVAGVDCQ